jgi:hypothetical protein
VAKSGWGARFLAEQDPNGLWGTGAYPSRLTSTNDSKKDTRESAITNRGLYTPKWTSTTYTLLTLFQIGLPPENSQAQLGSQILLDKGFYKDGGINLFQYSYKYSETCITGMILSILAYFKIKDERLHQIVAHLLGQQMPDGGWNCEYPKGATHASLHTTLLVLEGLLQYRQLHLAEFPSLTEAELRAHDFLLRHHLFRSHTTGEIFDDRMLRFPFPPRWRYDILHALDYFQFYARWVGKGPAVQRDERFQPAIDIIKKKQISDGRWMQYYGMSGKIYFELEPAGQPSRMNTLRAKRVLQWWEANR